MIIVLEGPDCAGKTTLAEAFTKLGAPVEVLHSTRATEETQWLVDTRLIWRAVQNERKGVHTVLDRSWIGDNIYSFIDPRNTRLGIHARRMESVLHRYGAYYIMCTPDPDELVAEYKKRYKERNELYGDKFHAIHLVMRLYRALWTGQAVPMVKDHPEQYTDLLTLKHPYSRRPLTRLYDRFMVCDQFRWASDVWEIARVETEWFRQSDPVRSLAEDEYLNLSGSLLTCRALLVGERAARPDKRCLWPFYTYAGSAGYLTRSLHRAGINELDLALVNAYSPRTMSTRPLEATLAWLAQHRPRVRVVALGREPASVLDELEHEDYAHVPHPQWARRFDHHGGYHRKLEAAIYGHSRDQHRVPPHGSVGVQTDLSAAEVLR